MRVVLIFYCAVLALVFSVAGGMLAYKLHKPAVEFCKVKGGPGFSGGVYKPCRPEGDAWTCFGGGRYEAMAEGKVCPGWEDL